MNATFDELARRLTPAVTHAALIDALYVIRAPRHLAGIVPMARQLRDWRRRYPALNTFPQVPHYADCLTTLDRIADLEGASDQLLGRLAAHFNAWTPLRPWTGDSVIGELLLVQAQVTADPESFEQVSAWLLWQAQRFHCKTTSRESYVRYLEGSRRTERLNAGRGSRLYGAYLALQRVTRLRVDGPKLADIAAITSAPFMGIADGRFPEASVQLTLLARLARLAPHTPQARSLRRYALEGRTDAQLDADLERVRQSLPAEFARVLITIWGGALRAASGGGHAAHRQAVERPLVRHGERLSEILGRVDEDEVHAGEAVALYPRTERSAHDDHEQDPDDPEETEALDPAVHLFLADDANLIRAHYAAKGIQAADEYQNAQLRWNKWTWSRLARERLLDWIRDPARLTEPVLDRQACLTLGLSLLTGRALREVAMPILAAGHPQLDADHSIGIDWETGTLYVYPGHPQLRRVARVDAPFCLPTGGVPRLQLPAAWRPLVQQQGTRSPRAGHAIVHNARRRLQALRDRWPELHCTEKGLRLALPAALAEQTRGDLGAQEVITSGAEANARNIIHYASYSLGQINRCWRAAADMLTGSSPNAVAPDESPQARPTAPAPAPADIDPWVAAGDDRGSTLMPGADGAVMLPNVGPCVGSQHAFDLEALAGYFKEVQARIRRAEIAGEWPRAFNLLGLYLTYWLNLALAGRKSLTPVPDLLLADGWALVADKHRADGSTDRLLPLTPSVQAQIDAYVAFASDLAVMVPELDPLVQTERGTAIRLHYIWWSKAHPKRRVVPYQPLYQERVEQLTPLPGNWGRKVVRSASSDLPGRYRDAALGHWVRGRHAWDATSTFAVEDFRERYLALQRALEAQLGFQVIAVAGCTQTNRAWRRLSSKAPKEPAAAPPTPEVTPEAARVWLETTDPVRYAALGRLTDKPTAARIPHAAQPHGQGSGAGSETKSGVVKPAEPVEPLSAQDALGLVEAAVHQRQADRPEELAAWADALCAVVRQRSGIPLFAVTPRPLFASKVVLQAAAVHTLGYLQQAILPAFLRDLTCLPERPTALTVEGTDAATRCTAVAALLTGVEGGSPEDRDLDTVATAAAADHPVAEDAMTRSARVASGGLDAAGREVATTADMPTVAEGTPAGNGEGTDPTKDASASVEKAAATDAGTMGPPPTLQTCQRDPGLLRVRQLREVELGRLVMIAIWRLGLARWSLVEARLRALHQGEPVLATGDNRYLVLHVTCGPTRQLVRRIVFLDDFTAAYLVVEHGCLAGSLERLFEQPVADASKATGLPLAPARRRARAEAALRAYVASLGVDGPSVSLARMADAAAQWVLLHSAPVVAAYAHGDLATEDLGDAELRRLADLEPARGSGRGRDPALPATKDPSLAGAELPRDLQSKLPLMQVLGRHRSSYRPEWKRLIGAYRPRDAVERVLQAFALWLLDHGDQQESAKTLSERQKRHLAARIQVVAAALIGFAGAVDVDSAGGMDNGGALHIDERTFTALRDATREQFPDRVYHGAWFHFYRFLADPDTDHGGCTIDRLGAAPERAISAKVLTLTELNTLGRLLASRRSGIATPALRTSAAHHVELMGTFGMRRAESAYLRGVDFQTDLCRVQAYGEHTLKTAWADRVLPLALTTPRAAAWLGQAQHRSKLIDPDAGAGVHPDNFFAALSQLLKQVTGDPSMGSHHLRHTLINRWVLTLLWESAGLNGPATDLPWLRGLQLESRHVEGLLGTEGDAGQGLRAVAALVGHSHPTTTLHHYIHVMGIALHGTLEKTDSLDLGRSFERRIGGKSTLQRWNQTWRARYAEIKDASARRHRCNRALRDWLEERYHDVGLDRDPTPRSRAVGPLQPFAGENVTDPDRIDFDRLEAVDRALRQGRGELEAATLERYLDGLGRLSQLRSGRRGERYRMRHVTHEVRARSVVPAWLARDVPTGTAAEAAQVLCAWLDDLRVRRPDDFAWLLQKWCDASARARGRMRLDCDAEIERARGLADPQRVQVVIQKAFVAKNRPQATTKRVPRLRLKCVGASGKMIARDTIATRWVLSYVAAWWLTAPLRADSQVGASAGRAPSA